MAWSDHSLTLHHPSARPRLDALTGARGPAALMVFSQHAGESGLLPWIWSSALAVSFFFVLSGFVLAYAYGDQRALGWDFYRARWGRIWPATMVSTGLVLLLLPRDAYPPLALSDGGTGVVFLSVLLMLQSLIPIPDVYFAFNSVSWSISVEWCFYLLFPFVLWGLRRRIWATMVMVLAVGLILTALAMALGWSGFDPAALAEPSWHGLVYINPLTRLWEFAVGILAGRLWLTTSLRSSIRLLLQQGFRNGRGWLAPSLEVLLIGVCLVCAYWVLPQGIVWAVPAAAPLQLLLLQWTSALCLVVVVVVLAAESSAFSRQWMAQPLMLRLGELSFGVYLMHQPLMRWLTIQMRNHPTGLLATCPKTVVLMGVLVVTLLLAAVSHDWIEPPARRWFKGQTVQSR